MTFSIQSGVRPEHVSLAAGYFWQAFQGKLGSTLGPTAKAEAFLSAAIAPNFAMSAVGAEGQLLGIAGYKTPQGGFVDGGMRDLQKVYGFLGGLWRGLFLGVLERDCEDGVLLMDGIFVGENARGQGVGQALLKAIVEEARSQGLDAVRLDVIDTNPRARQLYERFGFKAIGIQHLGPLRHIFKFRSATKMLFTLPTDQEPAKT